MRSKSDRDLNGINTQHLMDLLPSLNTLTQCAFCAHLNTSFATTCELCGDLLSPALNVSVAHLMNPTDAAGYCTTCTRRLLLNNRSCAFCNAFYHATPVGSSPLPRRRFPPVFTAASLSSPPSHPSALDALADTLFTVLIDGDGASELRLRPLLPEVRERILRPVERVDSDEVRGEEDSGEEQACAICLEPLRAHSYAQLPCCRNRFHLPCLQNWFDRRSTCPLCRQNLNEASL